LRTDNLLAKGQLLAESNLPVQAATGFLFRALSFTGSRHAQQHASPQSLVTHSQDASAKASPTNQQTSRIQETTCDGGYDRFGALSLSRYLGHRESRLQKTSASKNKDGDV
jgi:hypothetical protein